jgi:hypothetical protein
MRATRARTTAHAWRWALAVSRANCRRERSGTAPTHPRSRPRSEARTFDTSSRSRCLALLKTRHSPARPERKRASHRVQCRVSPRRARITHSPRECPGCPLHQHQSRLGARKRLASSVQERPYDHCLEQIGHLGTCGPLNGLGLTASGVSRPALAARAPPPPGGRTRRAPRPAATRDSKCDDYLLRSTKNSPSVC